MNDWEWVINVQRSVNSKTGTGTHKDYSKSILVIAIIIIIYIVIIFMIIIFIWTFLCIFNMPQSRLQKHWALPRHWLLYTKYLIFFIIIFWTFTMAHPAQSETGYWPFIWLTVLCRLFTFYFVLLLFLLLLAVGKFFVKFLFSFCFTSSSSSLGWDCIFGTKGLSRVRSLWLFSLSLSLSVS